LRELKSVRLGIIGLGRIALDTHLPLWLKMRDKVQVVALCDIDKKRLNIASNLFNVGRLHEDPFEMLSNEDLDLVDICTPPFSHKPLCLRAFNFDVNCIVEKPLVTSLDDFEELRKVVRKKNLNLFSIHNYSFVPVIRKARNLLLNGEIGEILQVDVKLSIFDKEFEDPSSWVHKLPGGILGEVAPHACYVLAEFLSGEIEEVKSQMVKRSAYPFFVGDELKVCVRTDKALGSFSVSLNSPTRKMVVDLLGSKSWVFMDCESQVLVKYSPPPTLSRALFHRGQRALSDIFQRTRCLAGASLNVIAGRYKPVIEGHKYLFGEAVKALNHQGPYPIDLGTVQKEVKILEDAFSQLNSPEKPCEAPSA
jgi:predicted dehydrogenase